LIEFLYRHPGEIFKAEALVLRVWPAESEPSTDALRATIKRIREKLWNEVIEAVPGAGYRFGK
jgi:DNA-binding response OmpR family regulator